MPHALPSLSLVDIYVCVGADTAVAVMSVSPPAHTVNTKYERPTTLTPGAVTTPYQDLCGAHMGCCSSSAGARGDNGAPAPSSAVTVHGAQPLHAEAAQTAAPAATRSEHNAPRATTVPPSSADAGRVDAAAVFGDAMEVNMDAPTANSVAEEAVGGGKPPLVPHVHGEVEPAKARATSSVHSTPKPSPTLSPLPSPQIPPAKRQEDGVDAVLAPAYMELPLASGGKKLSAMDRHKEAVAERKRQQVCARGCVATRDASARRCCAIDYMCTHGLLLSWSSVWLVALLPWAYVWKGWGWGFKGVNVAILLVQRCARSDSPCVFFSRRTGGGAGCHDAANERQRERRLPEGEVARSGAARAVWCRKG